MQPSEKPNPPQCSKNNDVCSGAHICNLPCWDLVPAQAWARLLSLSLAVPSVAPYFPGPVHPLETFGLGIMSVFCFRYVNQLIELYILFFQYLCIVTCSVPRAVSFGNTAMREICLPHSATSRLEVNSHQYAHVTDLGKPSIAHVL